MKPRDQKLALLRQLGQESRSMTLQELIDATQLRVSDRTIRRWLSELVNEGMVKKEGLTKAAKYTAVERPIVQTVDVSSCFGTESVSAITEISKPLFERKPVSYNLDWLEAYQPNQSTYFKEKQKQQLLSAGERANKQDPAGTYAHQIFNRLLIDLSYNSSRLEGNTYSLLDTEKLLLHGDSPQGKLDEEKVMILNHKEAIRYLVDNAPRLQASYNVVCTLHYLLADGLVEPQYAGKVRDFGVRIGGSTYIPFEDPKRLERQLVLITEKAAAIVDPFEQSLFLLAHISYLQAFEDVNKRTARLSANISLIMRNLVPLAFNDVQVKDYMSAMIAIYELQDVRPLVDLYIYSYLRTCSAYDSTVKALGFDEVRVRYRKERRDCVREVILKEMTADGFEDYIRQYAKKQIPEPLQERFFYNVIEDLNQMDESRLVGLGVTMDQLNLWLAKQRP